MFFNMFTRKNLKSNYFTSAFFLRCSSELSLQFSPRRVKPFQYYYNAERHYFKYLVIAGALLLTVKKTHMENDNDSLIELKKLYESEQYDLIIKKTDEYSSQTNDPVHRARIFDYQGKAYARIGKFSEAVLSYQNGINGLKNNSILNSQKEVELLLPKLLYNQGIAYKRDDFYEKSKQCYIKSLEHLEKCSISLKQVQLKIKIFTALGTIFSVEDNPKEANEQYKNALELLEKQKLLFVNIHKIHFNKITILYNQGLALNNLDQIEAAKDAYEAAIEIYTKNPSLLTTETKTKNLILKTRSNLGAVYRKLKMYKEAIDTYDQGLIDLQATAAEHKNLELETTFYCNRGVAFAEQNKYDAEAENDYLSALKINPLHINTLYNKGMLLIKSKQYDAAKILLENAKNLASEKESQTRTIKYKRKWYVLKNLIKASLNTIEKIETQSTLNEQRKHLQRYETLKTLKIDHLPSPYECAIFSEKAYDSLKIGDIINTKNNESWKVVDVTLTTITTHYTGIALFNKTKNQIVIAHRGTDGHDGSFASDIELFRRNFPTQKEDAEKFSKKVKAKYPTATFYHTGHSLGAALAEFCAYEEKVAAITFDSPGILEHIQLELGHDIDPAAFNVRTYLSYPNLINTMGKHIGTIIRIEPILYITSEADSSNDTIANRMMHNFSQWMFPRSTEKATELYNHIVATLSSHSMAAILKSFDPETGFPQTQSIIRTWPSSLNHFLRFIQFCQKHEKNNDYDLRYDSFKTQFSQASDLKKIKYELESFLYHVEDPQTDRLPLSYFGPNAKQAIRDYIINQSNIYHLDEDSILKHCSIKEKNGIEYLVFANNHPVIMMEDIATYFSFHIPEAFFIPEKQRQQTLLSAASQRFFSSTWTDFFQSFTPISEKKETNDVAIEPPSPF